MSNSISIFSALDSMAEVLVDIISTNKPKMLNSRHELSSFLLAGRNKANALPQDIIQAQIALDYINKITQSLRSNNGKYKQILLEFYAVFSTDKTYFLLGENGLVEKMKLLFALEKDEHDSLEANNTDLQEVIEAKLTIFISVHQCKGDWFSSAYIHNIPKISCNRPIYENMQHAINSLSDRSTAIIELQINKNQLLKITTIGGPSRMQLNNIEMHNIKALYDMDYRTCRYLIQQNNGTYELVETQPHPDHNINQSKQSSINNINQSLYNN